LSDSGYAKAKPDYINNLNCLRNYLKEFGSQGLKIIADNVSNKTFDRLKGDNLDVERTAYGNGAASFNHALEMALKNPDDSIVYLLEDDYLHRPGARKILMEGVNSGADYVSLYDHPDKYATDKASNPLVSGEGELTRVFHTDSVHWKITNSTTMTFAALVKTLKRDLAVIMEHTSGSHPRDFDMFIALRRKGRVLITPIPGYSTHGESSWLAPLTDWEKV
jgi:hypothetical protein